MTEKKQMDIICLSSVHIYIYIFSNNSFSFEHLFMNFSIPRLLFRKDSRGVWATRDLYER